MSTDPAFMTMTEIAGALARGEFTSSEITRLYLDRIAKADDKLHAYVSVDEDLAMSMARAADDRRAKGVALSPLDGVPFAAKDLCELKGTITTAGSQAWLDRQSQVDCTALVKCLQSGLVMLGKTHMVEFAFGGWGTNPVMGTPWNPWDLNTHRAPGGSSSGSGVAVAAGLAPAAIGSDTGGSVRIPSGLNGLTGLKTTRGLISLYGAVSLSHTLDTIGPMTHSAEDAALWTAIMAGADPLDPTSLHQPRFVWQSGATAPAGKPLSGMKFGVLPPEQYPLAVDPEELAAFEAMCAVLKDLGAALEPLPLPFDFHDLMVRNGQIIAAEAYAQHQAYIEDESLPLGQYVRGRVVGGKGISAAQYIESLKHQRACSQQYVELMQGFTAVLTPTFPFPALPLAEIDEAQTPMAAFCRAGNYLSTCGLALPAGLSQQGLPLSVQLLGKPFGEAAILRAGVAVQRVTDWHRQRPNLSSLGL
ncbi:amidase [Orrella daihaiensis]|uniref:Amidase n=1 Tax=Orrella daihaiensis TaxID=2782176 RepID=A0ABY4AJI1_9BURK|nr:amidase [Orrella daihaiensis]UOD50443.1 amidase [Orrella daihaiensis]